MDYKVIDRLCSCVRLIKRLALNLFQFLYIDFTADTPAEKLFSLRTI